MRVELPEGQWVELRERITHADDKAIRRARVRSQETPDEAMGEAETVALRIYIKAWNVLDADGNTLPLDEAAIDRLPMDLADKTFEQVARLYTGVTQPPNSPTPPSSDA